MSEYVSGSSLTRLQAVKRMFQLAEELRLAKDLDDLAGAGTGAWQQRSSSIIAAEQGDFVNDVEQAKAQRAEKRRRQAYKLGQLQLVPPLPVIDTRPSFHYYFIDEPEITCSLQTYYRSSGSGSLVVGDRLNIFRSRHYPNLPEARITRLNLGRSVKGSDRMVPLPTGPDVAYFGKITAKLQAALENSETDAAIPPTIEFEPSAPIQLRHLQVVPPLAPEI